VFESNFNNSIIHSTGTVNSRSVEHLVLQSCYIECVYEGVEQTIGNLKPMAIQFTD